MIDGQAALIEQALTYDFQTIADISGGKGEAAKWFYAAGKTVTLTAYQNKQVDAAFPEEITVVEHQPITAMQHVADESQDAVWCAHVLEHCLNPGQALSELHRILKPGGYLFLSVPPYKPNWVGGHVMTGWNIGSVMYLLRLAGFDIGQGAFIKYGYNIAAFVAKDTQQPEVIDQLSFSMHDLDRMRELFPATFGLAHNVYGDIKHCQWEWRVSHRRPLRKRARQWLKDRLLRVAYSLG